MEMINNLVSKIPVSQEILGYILVGLGALILVWVFLAFIFGRKRHKGPDRASAVTNKGMPGFSGEGVNQGLNSALKAVPSSARKASSVYIPNAHTAPTGGNYGQLPKEPHFPLDQHSGGETSNASKPPELRKETEFKGGSPGEPIRTPSKSGWKPVGFDNQVQSSMGQNEHIKPADKPMGTNVNPSLETTQTPIEASPKDKGPGQGSVGNALHKEVDLGTFQAKQEKELKQETKQGPRPEAMHVAPSTPPIDPALMGYIKSTRGLGHQDSAIRSELVKAGWNQVDVDRALAS